MRISSSIGWHFYLSDSSKMKPVQVGILYAGKFRGFTSVISPPKMGIYIARRHLPPNRRRFSRKSALICLLKFWKSNRKTSNTTSMPFLPLKPLIHKALRGVRLPSDCRTRVELELNII